VIASELDMKRGIVPDGAAPIACVWRRITISLVYGVRPGRKA
jgi:hypothetical protein